MGEVVAANVTGFTGIRQPGPTGLITERRHLSEPRELVNMHLTNEGHLFMPKAAFEVWDMSGEDGEDTDSRIMGVHYLGSPRGLIVQSSTGQIFHVSMEPPSSTAFPDPMIVTKIADMGTGEEDNPIWVLSTSEGYGLMGYAPRGSAGPDTDGKTWRVYNDWDDPLVEDLTATVTPTASYSNFFKGRRFWTKRGRTVFYSEIDDPTSERPENNSFVVGGIDAGDSPLTNLGYVQGMLSWEDVLIIFLSGSVWTLTGATPETWVLRQNMTITGNITARTLTPTDRGVLSYGGDNTNNPGVYLFTGNQAHLISDKIGQYLLNMGSVSSATVASGKYIISTGRGGVGNRQFLVFDITDEEWSVFDGFERGTVLTQSGLVDVSGEYVLYRSTDQTFPRYPGRGGRVVLGYHDDDHVTGWVRFLGVKVNGRKSGTGTPTITATITTSEGDTVTPSAIDLTDDVFEGLVIPVNLRGHGLEIELQVNPADDDNEVLIESVQLVMSRKGEKLGRV